MVLVTSSRKLREGEASGSKSRAVIASKRLKRRFCRQIRQIARPESLGTTNPRGRRLEETESDQRLAAPTRRGRRRAEATRGSAIVAIPLQQGRIVQAAQIRCRLYGPPGTATRHGRSLGRDRQIQHESSRDVCVRARCQSCQVCQRNNSKLGSGPTAAMSRVPSPYWGRARI